MADLGPVNPKRLHDLEDQARTIGRLIDQAIQSTSPPGRREFGFALLLFSFQGPEATWISNAERESMVQALKELIQRFEEGTADELSRPKGRG